MTGRAGADPGTAVPRRLVQLDLLRGVAILLVLGAHYVIPWERAGFFRPLAFVVDRVGGMGVDLFFVLSGYLIGGLLFDEIRRHGDLHAWRFLGRRAFKIWPGYYALVVLLVAKDLVRSSRRPREVLLDYLPNLVPFQVQNYFGHLPISHTWSLAVEEHFYLVLPLLLVAALAAPGRRGLRWVAPAVAAVMAGCLTARAVAIFAGFSRFHVAIQTHFRIDSLAFGVLLAHLHRSGSPTLLRAMRHRGLLLLAAVACVGTVMAAYMAFGPFTPAAQIAGYTLFAIGFGCLLMAVVATPDEARWLSSPVVRGLAAMGFLSYPIYLWHVNVVMPPVAKVCNGGMLAWLPDTPRWVVGWALYIGAAVAVGTVANALIDRPFLRLRDRLCPSRGKAVPRAGRAEAEAEAAGSAADR
jgi:peptidoglycan/LPS O-acetylase OafA/YrhL